MTRVVMFPTVFLFAFLFVVLMVLLLGKARRARVGVLIGVVLFVVGFFVFVPVFTYRRVAHEPLVEEYPTATVRTQSDQGTALMAVSPIWSEGVENEFEADIYPSRLAAARALGSRMEQPLRKVTDKWELPGRVVLFQEEHDRELCAAFAGTMEEALAGVACSTETDLRNLEPNEAGVILRFVDARGSNTHDDARSGGLEAKTFARGQQSSVNVRFSEKPWLEDFARYLSERPGVQVIVARSRETCTDENEARRQALQDACNQLSQAAGQKWEPVPGRPPLTVSSGDLQEGGFILDQFVQSFDGSAGKFWRQATLIDASSDKLAWLNDRKNAEVHAERAIWARMIASTLGVFAVIVATYFFLNMATKGYYDWSLRIAGLVLAIVGVIFIFLLS